MPSSNALPRSSDAPVRMTDFRKPRKPRTSPGVEARLCKHRNGPYYWTFRVRWTDPVTGQRRSEVLPTDSEAADYLAHLRLLKRRGNLHELDAGRETLAAFVETQWWPDYALGNLARNTLKSYAAVWNRHLLGRVGHLQLRQVTPQVVDKLRADLERDGVGAPTVRRSMAILQGIFARAVVWGRATSNPVAAVRKPAVVRQRAVEPLTPRVVELLRRQFLPGGSDAALISVLAYAGLRPEEALALQWRHVRSDTLLIEQKNVDGVILAGQKTDKPPRTIRLLQALAQDLADYRPAQGAAKPVAFLFARPDGKPWTETDYRNWRRRVWQPAAATVGIATLERATKTVVEDGRKRRRTSSSYHGPRPYDLRHSYASLRIHEGSLSLLEIALELGHGVDVLTGTYGHVLEEFRHQPRLGADDAISAARGVQQGRVQVPR